MAETSKSTPAGPEKNRGDTMVQELSDSKREMIFQELKKISLITGDLAKTMFDYGYTSLESVSSADIDDLGDVEGLDEEKAKLIKREAEDLMDSEEDGSEDALADWLTGEGEKDDLSGLLGEEIERAKQEEEELEELEDVDDDFVDDEENEALKAWLTGEDDSFSSWLGEETFEEEREELEEEIKEKEKDLDSKMGEVSALREEFEKRIEEIESDEFDIENIVEENAELTQEVNELQNRIDELEEEREMLNEEIDEIKQGSVAMLKYLKSQKKKGQVPTENLEGDVKKELERLREENESLRKKVDSLKSSVDYSDISDEDIQEVMEEKDNIIEQKENEIEEKNKKIQDLQDELNMKKEQLDNLQDKLEYKEEELNQREEDLMHREQKITKEKKQLEAKKQELGSMTEQERQRRLEELKKEIDQKEQELKAKEKFIDQKQRELRAREEDLIDEEIEERQEEILQEIEQEKAKTGTARLDDLLLGGIPLGSNVSIYGPPHVGKRVLINSFVAEGLEKGVPAIWVITDKTVEDIREEMKFVLPTYEEYEMRDLVYYVDAYSVSMGEVDKNIEDKEYVTYVEQQSDVDSITSAVEEFAEDIMEKHRYYRLAFESVSTLIAYLDTSTTFRSLQPFSGRRKRDRAVSLYTLEKGMHSEQDISMLGHMMDGEIEFKYQQLQTYLRVEGLGDVQTRDWVKYTASKTGVTMGSFSLDTIR